MELKDFIKKHRTTIDRFITNELQVKKVTPKVREELIHTNENLRMFARFEGVNLD